MKIESLKSKYKKMLAETISVSVDDLTETEETLISESFLIVEQKLAEIKTLEDEVKRLNLTVANLKAMNDNSDF